MPDPVSMTAQAGLPDPAGRGAADGPAAPEAVRRTAVAFEAVFLTEMLSHAGLGEARESFGGGPGEARFAGMLAREYGAALARQGGVGIAEHVFRALLERAGG
jgi:Rod binding domain-containing protein